MSYEKKFTPGPWVISEDKDIVTKQDIEGDVICLQPGFVGLNESQKYWEHNAHLIAGAPDLLQAAIRIIELSEHDGGHLKKGNGAFYLNEIKQAINKALNIKNDEL